MRNIAHAENVIHALLALSSLVTSSTKLEKLYSKIHDIMRDILHAENVAIFLYDADMQTITFDYFVDEKDGSFLQNKTMPLGQGISSYVIKQKKPCLLSSDEIIQLHEKGEISAIKGTLPESWMGAPLFHAGEVTGLVIVQQYNKGYAYEDKDLDILCFIATQISTVITQRLSQSELEMSLATIKRQHNDLKKAMDDLDNAQNELVQKEKMASLGGLVAGIAHEINTPIGICVTGITSLAHEYKSFVRKMESDNVKKRDLENLLEDVGDACQIIESNTRKAAELINSFKQIAVDQSSDAVREFDVKGYLDEVCLSLAPMLKNSIHKLNVVCPENIKMTSNPGALSQIITNLIHNSLLHAFSDVAPGNMYLEIEVKDTLILTYSDDGAGMSEDQLSKLFEPFYTTKRNNGGSGLGAHLIFNLVTAALKGNVSVKSKSGQGLQYKIVMPLILE